jgi:hypothetical protein
LRGFSALALAALFMAFGMTLLCGSDAQAQEMRPFHVGLTAGLNMSTLAYDPDITLSPGETHKMRTALRFGGDLEYAVNPMISLVSGLIYSMKGDKFTYSDEGETGKSTLKLSYLTIPAAIKVSIGESTGPRPFVKFGPELGILLSAKIKLDGFLGETTELDVKDNLKSSDLAILGGAGVEVPLGEMFSGVVEAGYEFGLTDVAKNDSESLSEESNMTRKTRNIYVVAGLRF